MVKTAVLVSGGGKNLQSLIDAGVFGELPQCELTAVIASNPESYAITRARISGIPCYIVDRSLFPNPTAYGFALLDKLRDLDIGLVVLAGYGCELTQPIFSHFGGRIIDTWPSLMPQKERRSGVAADADKVPQSFSLFRQTATPIRLHLTRQVLL